VTVPIRRRPSLSITRTVPADDRHTDAVTQQDWSEPSSGSVSFVTAPDVFRDQPVLTGKRVRLEPLTLAVLEDYLFALAEPEVRRLTGARVRFDRPEIEAWLATRAEHDDRADWAVVRAEGRRVSG
jgi:hypothetical protein